MPKTGKEMVKFLENNGFRQVRQNGSHVRMEKGEYKVSVPVHSNKTLPIGTEQKILKDAGLK